MAKNVKFVLNRRAFQRVVLQGHGTGMEKALRSALPGDDVVIEQSSNARGGGRMRARAYGRIGDEVETGALSRRLGRA